MTNTDPTHSNNTNTPWLGKGPVWIMILLIGPLALPFLWRSPHFSKGSKIAITIPLIVLTLLFLAALAFLWFNNITMETLENMANTSGIAL